MEEKSKHLHAGHRDRLKNKALQSGIEFWPDHEVLELLLTYAIPHKDVNPLAHELISSFGSFAAVFDAGYEQLKRIKGVGHHTALFLSLLPDIFDKYKASKDIDILKIDRSNKLVDYFRSISRVKKVEEFYVFCLDAKLRLIKCVKIDGGMESSISFSRKSFAEILAFEKCKSVVVMHTHPNGDVNPTQSDLKATLRLIDISNTLGVNFNDHLIVTKTQYFSFYDAGLLKRLKDQVENNSKESLIDFMPTDKTPNAEEVQ